MEAPIINPILAFSAKGGNWMDQTLLLSLIFFLIWMADSPPSKKLKSESHDEDTNVNEPIVLSEHIKELIQDDARCSSKIWSHTARLLGLVREIFNSTS